MKDRENRDSVEFDRLHEKDYSDKLIYGHSTLTEYEKAFIDERNHTMTFGIPIKPKRYLNKVDRYEEQSHYDYIGAPGGEEWPIPNTWEVNKIENVDDEGNEVNDIYVRPKQVINLNTWEVGAGPFGTIKGVYPPTPAAGIDSDYTKYHLNELIQNDMIDLKELVRQLFDGDYSKLSNVNINKGQEDMFSYTNNSPAAEDITEDEFIRAHRELIKKEKAKMAETYRPLPESVTIKKSFIDGLGLFAEQNLDKDVVLGISHHYVENGFISELIRTPLAAFCNHSTNPNCKIEPYQDGAGDGWEYRNFRLVTIKTIPKWTEMTVDYRNNLRGYTNYSFADFLVDTPLEDRIYQTNDGIKYYYNSIYGKFESTYGTFNNNPIFYTPEDAEKFLKRVK